MPLDPALVAVERGITAVYDRHSYDAEKREALLVWHRHLVRILERQQREAQTNVIPLATAP